MANPILNILDINAAMNKNRYTGRAKTVKRQIVIKLWISPDDFLESVSKIIWTVRASILPSKNIIGEMIILSKSKLVYRLLLPDLFKAFQ